MKSLKTQVKELQVKLKVSQRNELKQKEKGEGKQEILEPGVEKEGVKDFMTKRKHMNQLKENNDNVEKEKRIKNNPSECKKISSQDHEFPAKSQKTDNTCTICSKIFFKKSNLKLHIAAVHEGLKPFECPTCKKSFSAIADLKRHISEVHDKVKRFKCHFCDKSYGVSKHLKQHVKSIHES